MVKNSSQILRVMLRDIVSKNFWTDIISYSKVLPQGLSYPDSHTTKSAIILGTARTGSTLLSSYLDSLEKINSYGEILNPDIYPFFKMAAKLPYKRRLALLKIGFTLAENNGAIKLIFYQLERLSVTLEDLQTYFPSTKFIVIYRESLIDCYISLLRARATQEWNSESKRHSSENSTSKKLSFCVDKADFLEFCRKTKEDYIQCNSEAFLNRAMVVDYQSLVSHPQHLLREKICPFLGIDFTSVKTPLKKQITNSLPELVENFDELKEIIRSTDTLLRFERSHGGFY